MQMRGTKHGRIASVAAVVVTRHVSSTTSRAAFVPLVRSVVVASRAGAIHSETVTV